MWRVLFLLSVVMCSTALAQTQEEKEAYKFFEYKKISSESLKEKIQTFCNEANKTGWIGWIINYGTRDEIAKREKQIRKIYLQSSGNCHDSRITFLGSRHKRSQTKLWIVPPDEEPPTP